MSEVSRSGLRVLLLTALCVVVVYAMIFSMAPLSGEDFALTKDFGAIGWGERLHWIMARSLSQITGWNARLGEQLAIFWLGMPRAFFVIAQTLAFVALCFLSGTLLNRTDRKTYTLVALTLIFAVWPRMETFFWSTAAAEYLQPILLCLLIVRVYAVHESVWTLHRSRSQWAWLSAVSFLAGLSFENIPLAIAPFMIGSLWIEGRRAVSFRTVAPILALLAGWLALILAGSTGQRQAYYAGVFGAQALTPGVLLSRLPHALDVFFSSARVLTVLGLVSAVLLYRESGDRPRLVMLTGLVLLVALSVVAAPYIEPRAFILAWAVMFSLCVTAIAQVALRFHRGMALYALAAVLMLGFPALAIRYYQQFRTDSDIPDALVRHARPSPECVTGVPIMLTDRWYPRRFVSPRNEWYRANPDQVGAYYGCKILIRQQ